MIFQTNTFLLFSDNTHFFTVLSKFIYKLSNGTPLQQEVSFELWSVFTAIPFLCDHLNNTDKFG